MPLEEAFEVASRCEGMVQTVWGREVRMVPCGSWVVGEGKAYCDPCLEDIKLQYLQGWRYYPGDICPHGMYVGSCGFDWICGLCECE